MRERKHKNKITETDAALAAAERLDSLQGDVTLMKSAWEGLATTLYESGVGQFFRDRVQDITQFLVSLQQNDVFINGFYISV